jgi:hypothetical protein
VPYYPPPSAAATAERFGFADCTDNLTGNPNAFGTTFTAGASNADAAAVTLLSALSHDVHRVVLTLSGVGASGVNGNALADLLVDAAGGTTWTALIDDLVCGNSATGVRNGGFICYEFPLFIAAGSSVGIRARTAHTVDIAGGRAYIACYGNPSVTAMYWYGTAVETLGATPASSTGTAITPGTSAAFGSWGNIGTSTQRYGAIQVGIQNADSSALSNDFHFEIGYSSTRLPGSPTIYVNTDTAEVMARHSVGLAIPCDIAASTVIQARAKGSGATSENHFVTIYGVY